MNLETIGKTLQLRDIPELNVSTAADVRDRTRAQLAAAHELLDIDLSQTRFMDSSGLGALIALHKTMSGRGGRLRIINPTLSVQQILELTRLHRVFEIVKE